MKPDVARDLSDSAFDFERVVWPVIRPWLGGGELRAVEAVVHDGFDKELDTLSGIDGWHILRGEHAIRGIASRVQWGNAWDTFTIRMSRPNGVPTEYEKRLHALNNAERGFLLPHVTTQAYVADPAREGDLLSVALIRTTTLFREAERLVSTGRDGERGRWGFRTTYSGERLLWISWAVFRSPDIKVWRHGKQDARQQSDWISEYDAACRSLYGPAEQQ